MPKNVKLNLKVEQNPPEISLTEMLQNPLKYLPLIIEELRSITTEANQKKGMVIVEAFQQNYPNIYNDVLRLVDWEAAQVMNALITRWPWLALAKLRYPKESLKLIEFLQTQIKMRRSENVSTHKKQQRQISD